MITLNAQNQQDSLDSQLDAVSFVLNLQKNVLAPSSNPELQGMDLDIDWFRGECHLSKQEYRELVLFIFGCDPFYNNFDANIKIHKADPGYKNKATGQYGETIVWNENIDDNEKVSYDVAVTLPGSWLEAKFDLYGQIQFIYVLTRKYLCRATRIDLGMNDYDKSFSLPNDVIPALCANNYTGFKSKEIIISDKGGKGFNGFTINCGSRQSDSYTRFYETTVKHGYNANRIENEFKGDKARMVQRYLCQRYDELQGCNAGLDKELERQLSMESLMIDIGQLVLGQIDFIDKSNIGSNGSLENCPRLNWWQKLLDTWCGKIKVTVPKSKPTLKTRYNWMWKQWRKTLAILDKGLGISVLWELLNDFSLSVYDELTDEEDMWVAVLQSKGRSALTRG